MPADDFCLYHCLVAAVDLRRYYAASDTQRSMWARRLRCRTISVLNQHQLLDRARRLGLSGSAGYPDEEDFFYLSMASGLSFEIVQTGMAEPLCYGRSAIGATVQYVKVADGAGHLSDHYNLVQVYYDSRDPGRRLRLRRKTRPLAAMFVAPAAAEAMTDDVKIGQLSQHHSTIAAAISHYPFKRARALATVLSRDYGLVVKWKALQTYILRAGLWNRAAPVAAPSVSRPESSAAIPDAKLGDLPSYHGSIVTAIRENPNKRAKAMATLLLDRYKVVRVHWHALQPYIGRESL